MTTNDENTPNHNTSSNDETSPAMPPLYIKLDWGHIEKNHEMDYIFNGPDRGGWDVRFTVNYIGTKETKTIKYIKIMVQAMDRVDEPIGEPIEAKITGPLEPKEQNTSNYYGFLSDNKYTTLGSVKIVKIIIIYMDKTEVEINDENTINSIYFPTVDIKTAFSSTEAPLKLDPPNNLPIYMHFDFHPKEGEMYVKAIYMDDDDDEDKSKSTKFIDINFTFYDSSHNICSGRHWIYNKSLKPGNKIDTGFEGYSFQDASSWSIDRIVITYEDNTYIEIPKRMIESIISDENFEKAEQELERILREEEEAIRKAKEEKEAKQEARRKACCSQIDNVAVIFCKTPNDQNAQKLLCVLNEYCPNAEVMAANYLTNDIISKSCSGSLAILVFESGIHVTQAQRDEAKSFLARIAPKQNTEESFNEFKNRFVESICQELEERANAFLKTPNDQKAASLLDKLAGSFNSWLNKSWLTKELVSSACGEALQKMAFDTDNMVTQTHRNDAKSFLERIAPELNTEASYNAFKQRWIENLRTEIANTLTSSNDNHTVAKNLLDKLTECCPNDKMMAANYLTKELLAPLCGEVLQMIAYDTDIDITEEHRNDAKSFLARIAPELNSSESYKKVVNRKVKNNLIGCLITLISMILVIIFFIRACTKFF